MPFRIDIEQSRSREPIARQVARALREAVVTMRLKPGEMLSEQEIADQFGISRSPVREAFIKLGEAGLVRILPQRGTMVAKISQRAVEDARFIREAVECAVAREAARIRDPIALDRLADSLRRQRRAARAKDVQGFFTLDEEFHQLLADAAGRPATWHTIEDVKPQMDRVRYLSMEDATPLAVLVQQHAAVAAAVKTGDVPGAEAAMRSHLTEILGSLPALAAKHPELFDEGSPAARPAATRSA
ncbi:MAG TPA: GntR family transcriptional regulator [Dongiaceae bacterium]